MRNAIGKNGRYKVRVINASISTAKARKLFATARSYAGECRDAYLLGIRETIGGELGWAFATAVKSGDIRNAARFCRDGWRIAGEQDLFSAKMDTREFLREMRRLGDQAIREGGAE